MLSRVGQQLVVNSEGNDGTVFAALCGKDCSCRPRLPDLTRFQIDRSSVIFVLLQSACSKTRVLLKAPIIPKGIREAPPGPCLKLVERAAIREVTVSESNCNRRSHVNESLLSAFRCGHYVGI